VIVLLLCVVTVLLWLSMRKHLGKIRFDEDTGGTRSPDAGPAGDVPEPPDRNR